MNELKSRNFPVTASLPHESLCDFINDISIERREIAHIVNGSNNSLILFYYATKNSKY